MEKVKFGTTEFNLVPMGISVNDVKKTRSIRFISELDYPEIYTIVSNLNNMDTITIIGQDGNTQNTYADCIAFKGLGYEKDVVIDDVTTADVYTVTYSIDAVEKAMKSLNSQIDDLSNIIVIISMLWSERRW